jgi:hypothetical protein
MVGSELVGSIDLNARIIRYVPIGWVIGRSCIGMGFIGRLEEFYGIDSGDNGKIFS